VRAASFRVRFFPVPPKTPWPRGAAPVQKMQPNVVGLSDAASMGRHFVPRVGDLSQRGGADEGDEGSVVVLAPGHGQRRSTEHAVSLSDASNGKSSRLLTTVLTVESQPALTEVVVPSVRRIDLRCRPIESVGFQSRILAVLGAAATEQRMKSRSCLGPRAPCMPLCHCTPNPR